MTNHLRTRTVTSWTRKVATAAAISVGLGTPACFALFSLDGYGPPAEPTDASTDGSAEASPRDGGAEGSTARTIFVTSTTFNGNLGARDGGDDKCQRAASLAGLTGGYRAWLSVQGSNAAEGLVLDAGPLRLPDGTIVANDTADLARNGPRAGIMADEKGRRVGGGGCADGGLVAWTGTPGDGGASSPFPVVCADWKVSGSGSGLVGLVGSTGATWTAACVRPCQEQAALYCIQQ